jgi:putative oxidoreductase
MSVARRVFLLLMRLGLGGLLLVAGALKMRAPAAFSTEIANYQLLPSHLHILAPILASTLPAVEMVLGVALLAAPWAWRRAASVGALGLLLAFSVAVGSAYFRHINIECGCFGTGSSPITFLTLMRNLLLTSGAGLLLWLERGPTRDLKAPG